MDLHISLFLLLCIWWKLLIPIAIVVTPLYNATLERVAQIAQFDRVLWEAKGGRR
jgi:hypothetical protein